MGIDVQQRWVRGRHVQLVDELRELLRHPNGHAEGRIGYDGGWLSWDRRERLIACVVAAVVIVVAVWILLVSPERNKAASLNTQIAAARSTLAADEAQVALAEQARTTYPKEVRAVKLIENAAPLTDQEPQLIDLLNRLEVGHVIRWTTTGLATGGATGAGFPTIGLTFAFNASYLRFQKFFAAIDALTATDGTNLLVKGRLFTIDSATFAKGTATVTMTVYESPQSVPSTTTPAAP